MHLVRKRIVNRRWALISPPDESIEMHYWVHSPEDSISPIDVADAAEDLIAATPQLIFREKLETKL